MAKLGISLQGIAINEGYSKVPDGTYDVKIVKTEMKGTKSGGQMLSLHLKIDSGDFAGKMIFDNLNIDNPNSETVRIAMEALATYAYATGLNSGVIDDSDDLITNNSFQVAVKTKGDYQNVTSIIRTIPLPKKEEIKAQPAAAAPSKRPWEK